MFRNINGKIYHSRQEEYYSAISPPVKKEPSIEDLTPEQLQAEYDVAVDLRDSTKLAEATRILGELPAGKELVKYRNTFRIRTSLSNLIILAKAGIQFVYITAPHWVSPAHLVKDSTEIQTVEDVDSQSLAPPLYPLRRNLI